ncbi:nitroreductase family protein [Psychrobacter cryohalolentis]|uniref:Putative NAD(P)H nitroreductase n=1 Tax=Psychrobacter cryohalolentis (strain ATCC BAA-1226 / DSM 17306 / VKM B-2378 / K5) TaxID=335284 RepID=Q1QBS7_PSYCK|nr:nitroreductase [Psychrobacter cryohalolentis]ABE74876.1 nitroreductase [Psychrobacter cryohalolentis K5]ASE25087.1 nitroreductase [Psychrobacter cryohalolentis]
MSTSEKSHNHNNDEPNNTESPIVTNSQVTDEQLINWIKSRRSIGNLSIPAPTESQIKAAIDCAVTAPDHKKLQPWRFIVTQGNARHELGRAFLVAAEAKAAQEGDTLSEKDRQKTYNMPLRAPVIITVVTQMQAHKKVPPFEQMLSAGAVVQNLILALKAQGFSTVWRTGLLCNEPAVKAYFDVSADDYVTAFVYTGTSTCDMPTRKPIDIEPLTRFEQ